MISVDFTGIIQENQKLDDPAARATVIAMAAGKERWSLSNRGISTQATPLDHLTLDLKFDLAQVGKWGSIFI